MSGMGERERTFFPRIIRHPCCNFFLKPLKRFENNTTEDNGNVKEKILRWSLIAAAVFAVIEILLLLGLTVQWLDFRADLEPLEPQQLQISIPSEKFFIKNDDGTTKHCPATLKERKQANSTRCYGTLSDVMDELLAKIVFERYNSDINPEHASIDYTTFDCKRSQQQHRSIKLVGIATDKTAVQVGLRSKLFWNSQTPPSYTKSDLTYFQEDGTIFVEKKGLYFVSLQLKTKWIMTSSGNDTDNTIKHFVHQISNGTEAVILEDVRTMCETSAHDAESTSAIGTIFKLEYGDRLYAATSHPKNIAPDPHNNYFSVYTV